jgi:hypothetical protein
MLFIIYSCEKYKKRAKLLYDLVKHRLPTCRIFIVTGNPDVDEDYKIDNMRIIFKCRDGYEYLSEKTMALCKTIFTIFPEETGFIKCDDDIIPNYSKFNEMIRFIEQTTPDYLGRSIHQQEDIETYLPRNDFSAICKKSTYAAGPLYYLSKRAAEILKSSNVNTQEFLYEDNMVGYFLNQSGIYPIEYDVYSDRIEDILIHIVHNNMKRNYLFLKLQGDIQDQYFQLAHGLKMAKESNRILVFVFLCDNSVEHSIANMSLNIPFIHHDDLDYGTIIVTTKSTTDTIWEYEDMLLTIRL